MIDLKWIREHPDQARAALGRRGGDVVALVDRALELDAQWRERLQRVERLKAQRNAASEEVARLKRAGQDASSMIAELKTLSDSIKQLDTEVRELEEQLREILLRIPNRPMEDVPDGDATCNRVVFSWGEPRRFDFEPKPHWELGQRLGILDLPRGAKVAGSGFPVFTGAGARLVRALISFMIDLHTREHDYVEVAPPLLVNAATALGTGQLPDLEKNMYVTEDGLYLIPTAEVPVTNLHREEILSAEELPKAYVAYTPCFRREAGAHGKETRGLIRIHQFDKVELVRFCKPEQSAEEHRKLVDHAEAVLRRLELPYRRVLLAAGDLGFASAKTYDLEVWAAGVGMWLEASSASCFTDFQARRANIRYRPSSDAKPEYVHTLNASGVAFPRTLIALLENNQEEDGRVRLPQALVPYFGSEWLVPQ
ncbi:MAG: serine--tRNA ligase [Gemmatimonadales bacterium]|nr:Serine--tRNA ligase [bacterium HR33]GIW51020.1 MAG: serine--tRNA ligase [Gemmatimonadales bacterium]